MMRPLYISLDPSLQLVEGKIHVRETFPCFGLGCRQSQLLLSHTFCILATLGDFQNTLVTI